MYTLQILDAGQTFLHQIGDRPVVIGSAEGVTVRLREQGVAPQHAHFVPFAGGVRLVADSETNVNGEVVDTAELRLGDRIEIGRAVLVVGRTVQRAAEPEDVLESPPITRVARSPRRPQKSSSPLLPILAGVAVLGVVAFFLIKGDDSGQANALINTVNHLVATGNIEQARTDIAHLRRSWVGAEDDRLARLDRAEQAIAKMEATHDGLVTEIRDPANERTYAEWSDELQSLEARGTSDQRVAARKVRSRLRSLLRERDDERDRLAIAARAAAGGGTPVADRGEGGSGAAGTVPDSDAAGDPITAELDEVERCCQAGSYAQALALIQAAFDLAKDPRATARLRDAEQGVRARARQAMDEVLAEAHEAEKDGRIEHAIALLQGGRHHFPGGPEFESMGTELSRLQAGLVATAGDGAAGGAGEAVGGDGQPGAASAPTGTGSPAPKAPSTQSLADLRKVLQAVRAAEDLGDFAEAATLLRQAATAVRERDADYAGRLRGRAEEAELLASWNEAVVDAMRAGKQLSTIDENDQEVLLTGVEGSRVRARGVEGDYDLVWHEVSPAGMKSLAKQIRAEGKPMLALAALLYRQRAVADAEELLIAAFRQHEDLRPQIQAVVARGRGEVVDERGYTVQKGELVAVRTIELRKEAKQLRGPLTSAMRSKDPDDRGQFLRETLAAGGTVAEALPFAVRDLLDGMCAKIAQSPLRQQVDKLRAERDKLDEARRHAKELIYDEARYFYPYKPPAVSGARHAEYNKVQAEVNERVAALRAVWDGSRTRVRVPDRLVREVEQIEWLAEQLGHLGGYTAGETPSSVVEPLAWVRALGTGSVTLQSYCRTPAEQEERKYWLRVLAYNEAVADEVSPAVNRLLEITNDYRAMYGHRPLAVVRIACDGSQSHADEMSKLGYFSHFSPVPGRRTPIERMRLAGYMFGVSENIAKVSGAQGAHDAWCRSSGHHRNLLNPNHREIGIGANGRYWVQNFGSGEMHRSHAVWPSTAAK